MHYHIPRHEREIFTSYHYEIFILLGFLFDQMNVYDTRKNTLRLNYARFVRVREIKKEEKKT